MSLFDWKKQEQPSLFPEMNKVGYAQGIKTGLCALAMATCTSGTVAAPRANVPPAWEPMPRFDPVASHIRENEERYALIDKFTKRNLKGPLNARTLLEEMPAEYFRKLEQQWREHLFVIDKERQEASVYRLTLEKVATSPVSTGETAGEKFLAGDKRTPSGFFEVVSVEKSSSWMHGGKLGSYGNHFARLDAGSWDSRGRHFPERKSSIGLHGTNEPYLLGSRASEGCVRFPNAFNDYAVSNGLLRKGSLVSILPEGERR